MFGLISQILLIALCYAVVPTHACGGGGIGAPTSGAVIALCVLFLPVIIPVAAVGGTGYIAYKGIKKGAGLAAKIKDRNVRRKRNSDIIKTQMNRALKQVGKPAFTEYIQTMFDSVKESNSAYNNFELGIALFLNKDLIGAEEYLTKSIDIAKPLYATKSQQREWIHFAHSYFIRGLVNQYLWDFDSAAKDFQEAIQLFESDATLCDALNANVPQLTSLDAHNSYGFAVALKALYGIKSSSSSSEDNDSSSLKDETLDDEKVQLLDRAIDEYTLAIGRSSVPQGMWLHNRGVARYFRTYYVKFQGEDYVRQELELALADFEAAVHSGNFGTAADAYAMIAQVLARLKKNYRGKSAKDFESDIEKNIGLAYEADPKVFMVDVNNEIELSIPWPLPRHDYMYKKSSHEFAKVHFAKPTWCHHCMDFIANPVGKQGYECVACNYSVHSKCFPQVKAKTCWTREQKELIFSPTTRQNRQETKKHLSTVKGTYKGVDDVTATDDKPLSLSHNHHFKPSWFSKPTWCDYCGKFVVSPVGKQGYTCADCGYKVHKDCAASVPGYIDG
jgi:tetratricopeptide (TPR) repeat protein